MTDWRNNKHMTMTKHPYLSGQISSRQHLYLSGPMRGYEDFNFPLFYAVEGMLDLWGWRVTSPARMDMVEQQAHFNKAEGRILPNSSFTIQDALRRDYKIVLSVDAIAALPGWENSEGACREIAIGLDIGIPVYPVDIRNGKLGAALDPQECRQAIHKRLAPKVG